MFNVSQCAIYLLTFQFVNITFHVDIYDNFSLIDFFLLNNNEIMSTTTYRTPGINYNILHIHN